MTQRTILRRLQNQRMAKWLSTIPVKDTDGTIAGQANILRQGMLAPKMKAAWEKAIALDSKNLGARLSLIQFYTQAPSLMGGSMDKAKEMARQI